MKLHKKHIDQIVNILKSSKNLDDLRELIALTHEIEIQNNIYSVENTNRITLKKLNHYYYNHNKKYINFKIPKKSGGVREIVAPDKTLKFILQKINLILSNIHQPTIHSHGFLFGRSIKTNAQKHINKKFILNIDIKDFFPSVNFYRIKKELQQKPFLLQEPFAKIIANFCCLNKVLPQGAPTSPIITNIVCKNLDINLSKIAKKYKLDYTRYADDITFSGNKFVFSKKLFKEIEKELKKEKFKLNPEKTRIQNRSMRQEVTGLVVNEKVNVNRKYIRNLRALIHNYKNKKNVPDNAEFIIAGKLEFLKMIRGKDEIYQKLFTKFIK